MYTPPTQWPCGFWFHIPDESELQSLKDIVTTTWGMATTFYYDYLHFPKCYYLNRSSGTINSSYWYLRIWGNKMTARDSAVSFQIDENDQVLVKNDKPANWFNIRAFANNPVVPDANDNNWHQTYQPWSGIEWVWYNSTLWLISISADGTNWITMQDKNVWATVVYNLNDTVTEANAWWFFQFWNNHWFPFSWATNFYTSTQNTTGFWPTNPYDSSYWVKVSTNYWFTNTNNSIWGYGSSDQIQNKVQEVWLWSNKIYPSMRLVLQWYGWSVYEANGEYIFTDEMWWSVDIIMKVPTTFNTTPTGYHKWYAEEYWFLNQWCQKYWVYWQDFLDLYNIDWYNFSWILSESYTVSSWQCSQLWTYDWTQFYMRGSWTTWAWGNNYLAFADSNYTNYYKIERPPSYIDASINPWGVYWTPFYAKNNTIRVTSFSCTSQPYRCEAAIIFWPFDRIMMNYSVRPETLMQSWWVVAIWNNNMAFLTSFYMNDWAIWGNYYQGQLMNCKFSFNMEWHSQSNMWYFPYYEILATDAQSMNPVTVDIWTAYWYNNQYWPVFSNPFIWLPSGYSYNEMYTGIVEIL